MSDIQKKVDELTAQNADLTKKLAEANDKLAKAAKKPGNAAEDALDGGADDDEETPAKAKKFRDAVAAEVAKQVAVIKTDETVEFEGTVIRKSEAGAQFAVIKALVDKNELADFAKAAETTFAALPGEPVAKAKALRAVSKLGKEDREAVEVMLKAGHAAMKSGMTEVGKAGEGVNSDDALEALAKKYAADHKVSIVKARAEVLDTEEGRALYATIGTKAVSE